MIGICSRVWVVLFAGVVLLFRSAVWAQVPEVDRSLNPTMEMNDRDGKVLIRWVGKLGKRYNVRSSMVPGGNPMEWEVAEGDVIGSPPFNSVELDMPQGDRRFYVVEEYPAPLLGRLLLLGDSHIEVHTNPATATRGASRYSTGPAIWTCSRFGQGIKLVARTNGYPSGNGSDLDHGYPGWSAGSILTSWDGIHYPVAHALTKEFDAVLIQCGGNDVALVDAATAAARVVAVGNAMKTSGKPVIITGVFPRGPKRGVIERDRIRQLNELLPGLCETSGLLWLPWHSLIETDQDGYATPTHIVDWSTSQVHVNSLGAQLLGGALSDFLERHFTIGASWTPPPVGDPLWITPNPYVAGPANTVPTSWRFLGAGTAIFSKYTDGDGDTWQQVTISGNPSYALSRLFIYQTLAGGTWTPGDAVRGCCRFQGVSEGWDFKGGSLLLDVYDTANRQTQDMLTSESGAQILTRPLLPFSGLLLTEPWVTTGASQVPFSLQLFGNGTIRFRQAGVVKAGP